MNSNQIVVPAPRRVRVDRRIPSAHAFEDLGRKPYVDTRYLVDLPRGREDVVNVEFFEVPQGVWSNNGVPVPQLLRAEYKKRRLVADPRAQAQANVLSRGMITDREGDMPTNGSYFMSGQYCVYVVFGRKDAWPVVALGTHIFPWHEPCLLFAGVPDENG